MGLIQVLNSAFIVASFLRLCGATSVHETNFVKLEKGLGERVITIRFGGISAVEETASDGPEIDIIIRQITDGHRLVQSVYDDQMILRECKVDTDETTIQNFLAKITTLSEEATVTDTNNKPHLDLSYAFNSTELTETRQLLRQHKTDLPKQLQSILDINTAKLQCRNLGRTMKDSLKRRRGQDEQKAGEDGLRRNRRDLLIFPGTLWCGVGNTAEDENELGENQSVDQCCRTHDHCPNYIESFQTRFDIFNYRMYTISDCQCDTEFLQCLSNTGSSLGDAIARAYFSTLALSCFNLVPEEKCVEFGLWGRCLRTNIVDVGVIDRVQPVETVENSYR